jgi:hypothetical protein
VLAIAIVFAYFRGRKKNAWISGWIASETEQALNPTEQNYVNIGGTIGYNFKYKLKKPYSRAKGTFTLLPRQSLLYMPISLLISKHDRYYLNIFTKEKLLGEGHIISDDYINRMRTSIKGIERMDKKIVDTENGKKFMLLWANHRLEKPLENMLNKISNKDLLKHFCCYGDNKTFFVHMKPKKDAIKQTLEEVKNNLNIFFDNKNPLTKDQKTSADSEPEEESNPNNNNE